MAEIGVTANTLDRVAALVRQRAAAWTGHAVAIEAAWLAAKRRIQDAASPRALRQARRSTGAAEAAFATDILPQVRA